MDVESAEVVQQPTSRVPVEEEEAARLMRLIDALEENDDINAVHANFDVDAEVLSASPAEGRYAAAGVPLWRMR